MLRRSRRQTAPAGQSSAAQLAVPDPRATMPGQSKRNDARASVARGPSQHSTLIRDASLRVVQRSHRQQVASSAASQAASQAAQWCRNHPASAAPQAWRTTRRPSFGSPVASHSAPRRRSW
eukprot:7537742-Pyramimonas_sp.AAC.1